MGDASFNPSNTSATPLTETISKAVLTVTANNQSIVYGSALPSLTYTITGFQNSETLATSGARNGTASTDHNRLPVKMQSTGRQRPECRKLFLHQRRWHVDCRPQSPRRSRPSPRPALRTDGGGHGNRTYTSPDLKHRLECVGRERGGE